MNKQKGFAPIIIVLTIVFLIGGIFILQYWWTSKGEVLKEVIEPGEVIENETDGWKVYRNEEHGFEIKHPQELLIVQNLTNGGGEFQYCLSTQEDANHLCKAIIGFEFPDTNFKIGLFIIEMENNKYGYSDNPNVWYSSDRKFGYELVYVSDQISSKPSDLERNIFYQMISTFRFTEEEVVEERESPKIIESNEADVEEDQVVDWRVYRNYGHDFQMNYPSNYKLILHKEGNIGPQIGLDDSESFIFMVENNPDHLPLSNWTSNSKEWIGVSAGGVEGLKTTAIFDDLVAINMILSRDDKIYHFIFVCEEKNRSAGTKIFNLMISTFKFLEKDEGLNTYKNEEYKYEIKYPDNWNISVSTNDSVNIINPASGSYLQIRKIKDDIEYEDLLNELKITNDADEILSITKIVKIDGLNLVIRINGDQEPPSVIFELMGTDPEGRNLIVHAYSGDINDNIILEEMISTFRSFAEGMTVDMIKRDARRRSDIRMFASDMDLYYSDFERYVQSKEIPNSLTIFTDPKTNKRYGWIDNTQKSQFFCVYSKLESGDWISLSQNGIKENLESEPTDLSSCE